MQLSLTEILDFTKDKILLNQEFAYEFKEALDKGKKIDLKITYLHGKLNVVTGLFQKNGRVWNKISF